MAWVKRRAAAAWVKQRQRRTEKASDHPGLAIPKGPTADQRRRRNSQDRRTARDLCTDTVWLRNGDGRTGHCEFLADPEAQPCGRLVYRSHVDFRLVGHVDEIIPRSRGGDPTDPRNCRLVCHACHFSGPSGAHRRTTR